jgi:tRNA dimethylallyltransferase
MNLSDKKNPRRLVRAIEIAEFFKSDITKTLRPFVRKKMDLLFIGLTAPKEILDKKIEARVVERINKGLLGEIKELLEEGITWEIQSMNTLGYKEWKDYFEGDKSEENVIRDWILDERQYAKRQMTWFKKDKRINWFNITQKGWKDGVEKLVQKWNNEVDAKKD